MNVIHTNELLQPTSPNLISIVEVQRKAKKFREYELMCVNCFVILTGLRSVQNVEKGIVCFLDTKRMGSNDRKYLFEASALLC